MQDRHPSTEPAGMSLMPREKSGGNASIFPQDVTSTFAIAPTLRQAVAFGVLEDAQLAAGLSSR